MAFNYNRLWKLLIDRNMMRKHLMEQTGITSTTMAKMSKGLPVSMDVLARICEAMDVNICDIVVYEKESKGKDIGNKK